MDDKFKTSKLDINDCKSSFKILRGTNQSEQIRIKSDEIELHLKFFKGKSQGCFVLFAPSVQLSGYGKNEKEALESFNYH